MPDNELFDNSSTENLLNPPEGSPENGAGDVASIPIESEKPTDDAGIKAGLSVDDIKKIVTESTSDLQERLTTAEQWNTYLRGRLSERSEKSPESAKPEEPKPFEYNMEQLAKDMETDAPRALTGFVRDLLQHELGKIREEVGKTVDTRVGANDRRRSINDAYRSDVQNVSNRFGNLLQDKSFIKDADAVILEIIQARGGRDVNDYQPGDLLSAASRVYGDWALAGKIKPSTDGNGANAQPGQVPSLREVRRLPGSDNGFGDRGGGTRAVGPAKTIDQLFSSPRDRQIAKGIFKQVHDAEPNITEERWVSSYLRAREEDSDFDR